nr:hypothetical protein [Streptomyces chartreusis]
MPQDCCGASAHHGEEQGPLFLRGLPGEAVLKVAGPGGFRTAPEQASEQRWDVAARPQCRVVESYGQ